MKVIQTVAYIGDESSGPAYSVPSLCNALAIAGAEVNFCTLAPMPPQLDTFKALSYPRHIFPHHAYGRSPEMLLAMKKACESSDIIHNHALWMAPNIYAEKAKRGTNCKLVVSPRGSLAEWALKHSRIKKFLIWHYGQKKALHNTDMFHATCEQEYLEIRKLGFKQPVAIIPNGINIPELDFTAEKKNCKKMRKLIFMSRIHPKKNIESLLHAWNKVQSNFTDWELLIIGPDENNVYADQMKKLSTKLGNERVIFCGEIVGENKLKQLAEADLFVLPTHNENFGMVVAEALACGTPVICTVGAPWQGLEKANAGWWIDIGEDALSSCLKHAMGLSESALAEMGQNGRIWMLKDYSWNEIGKRMKRAYGWLVNGGNKPEWIITD